MLKFTGTYGCCYSTDRRLNNSLFRQFEVAQQHAPQIGLSLRRIFNVVNAPKINVVGHSLGCKVAASSLFDIVPSGIPTPDNARINLCLIAPAIGGIETFRHYHERETSFDFKKKDNYRVYILYNETDYVLKKKDNKLGVFGPGTMKYGETTLGCNYHDEVLKLEKYFAQHFPQSAMKAEDVSYLGKRHSLRYYVRSEVLKEMVVFMNYDLASQE